jgi:hypothetical protein
MITYFPIMPTNCPFATLPSTTVLHLLLPSTQLPAYIDRASNHSLLLLPLPT